jgi:hypothetical protein
VLHVHDANLAREALPRSVMKSRRLIGFLRVWRGPYPSTSWTETVARIAAKLGRSSPRRDRDRAGQAAGPAMSAMPVRRGKAALSSGCKSHPATAPAGSNRSSHGGDEMAEAFG